MKEYKDYRYGVGDDKNFVLERRSVVTATKDTKHHKQGDEHVVWSFVGYYSSLEQLLLGLAKRITLDKFDSDLLKELQEFKGYVKEVFAV